jgi:hypothetical protein
MTGLNQKNNIKGNKDYRMKGWISFKTAGGFISGRIKQK